MSISVTKLYKDIPFAHRQSSHAGHCAFIHGHNWAFEFEFICNRLEPDTGFVIDFGKLEWLKKMLNEWDHKCLLSQNDPVLKILEGMREFIRIVEVPDCSCEGLAMYLYEEVNRELIIQEKYRVKLKRVTVFEDSKNSATCSFPDGPTRI